MKRFFYFVTLNIVIFYSTLNAQWVQTNFPYGGTVTCLAAGLNGASTNLFAGTYDAGIFLSTNDGTSWQEINNGLGDSAVTSIEVNGSNIYAGTSRNIWPLDRGKIFYSTNSGANWQAADTSFPDERIECFAIKDSIIIAGTYIQEGSEIYLSRNNGSTWNKVFLFPHYCIITSLIVKDSNIFAGTSGLGFRGGLFQTSNNGETWAKIDSTLKFSSLALNGTDLLAGTTTGVYLSADNGISWRSINNGLPDYVNGGSITTLSVSPDGVGGNNLFAGTDSAGVFLSTNNGTNWSSIGLLDNHVYDLTITDTSLFARTDYGLWRYPLSELLTGVEDQSIEVPSQFILEQNYPNPFNPSTTINFSVTSSKFVTLKVFDVIGNEVATLVNEEKPVGNYEVEFSAKELSGGIYFYKLQTGNFTATKKMILLK